MWMHALGRMWLGWFHRCQLITVYPGLTVSCLVLPEAFYRLGTEKLEPLSLSWLGRHGGKLLSCILVGKNSQNNLVTALQVV